MVEQEAPHNSNPSQLPGPPIRILLVEDDEDDYLLIRDLLGEIPESKFTLEWVASFDEAIARVQQQQHDVYLIDYRLQEHNGLELLAAVQQQGNDAPVIVMSGRCDRQLDITALRQGAADYLDKAYLQSSLLEHYIRAAIERDRALKKLQHSEHRYRELFEREQRLNEELIRSNAELEDFAYIASHDLQEPLRAVSGFAQLLDAEYRQQLDETATEYLDFIIDGAKRMRALVGDLLAYSRIAQEEIDFVPVACHDAVAEAIENLQSIIQETAARIEYCHLPVVRGHHSMLVQLFQNLLHNSMKFHRLEVRPRVEISARLRDDGYWLLSVADNGIGISEEYHDRIFKIFKRLHTQREFPGTGVGLSLCQKIVKRHGGEIWLSSQVGSGTTFYLTLPSVKSAQI